MVALARSSLGFGRRLVAWRWGGAREGVDAALDGSVEMAGDVGSEALEGVVEAEGVELVE